MENRKDNGVDGKRLRRIENDFSSEMMFTGSLFSNGKTGNSYDDAGFVPWNAI
jgi:hypothetical protein